MFVICSMAMCMLMACGSKNTNSNEEEEFTVKGVDGKDYTSYQEACRTEDFEAAHMFLDHYYNLYMEEYGKSAYYSDYDLRTTRTKYQSASKYIFKQEMMYCISDGSKQASDKVIYLLTEIPVEGSSLPEGEYAYYQISESSKQGKDYTSYRYWVLNYNICCNQVLDLAISQNNEYLAKKVIGMYKQNMLTEEGPNQGISTKYYVKYSWADKNSAIAKCKAAGINI